MAVSIRAKATLPTLLSARLIESANGECTLIKVGILFEPVGESGGRCEDLVGWTMARERHWLLCVDSRRLRTCALRSLLRMGAAGLVQCGEEARRAMTDLVRHGILGML